MDVYALIAATNGEIVRNRARVRVGSEIVVVAELENGVLTLNEAGRRMVNQATSEVVEVKKARKPRTATVESPAVVSDVAPTDAVEVGLSAPETAAE